MADVRVRVTAEGEPSPAGADAGRTPAASPRLGRRRPAGRVLIEVSDRGPGIDAAEQRRIFEPFVRGRAAAAARVPGNGLGLSIVKRVSWRRMGERWGR